MGRSRSGESQRHRTQHCGSVGAMTGNSTVNLGAEGASVVGRCEEWFIVSFTFSRDIGLDQGGDGWNSRFYVPRSPWPEFIVGSLNRSLFDAGEPLVGDPKESLSDRGFLSGEMFYKLGVFGFDKGEVEGVEFSYKIFKEKFHRFGHKIGVESVNDFEDPADRQSRHPGFIGDLTANHLNAVGGDKCSIG